MKLLGEDNLDLLYFLAIYLLGRRGGDHKEWCHVVRCGSGDALHRSSSLSYQTSKKSTSSNNNSDGYPFLGSVLEYVRLFKTSTQRRSPYLRVSSGLETLTGSTNFMLVEYDYSRGIWQMYLEEIPSVEIHDF
jgi:hypothetical protein